MGFEAMKPISRRSLIALLAALAVTFDLLLPTAASAQSDPLPSWNDGPAKQAIVNFVKATTDHRTRTSCRPRSGSLPSIRMGRCGSSIRCTPRWSTAWNGSRPSSRQTRNWPMSSPLRR